MQQAFPPAGAVPEPPADAVPEPPPDADRPTPRSFVLAVGMLVSSVLLAVLVVLPAPYAVTMPGPTTDVLGEEGGTPLIRVSGAPTYASTGQLRLTTVSATGSPDYPSSVAGVLRGWLSSASVVRPVEDVIPSGHTQQEIDEENAVEMTTSQENATVAALVELGYQVPATLTVAHTVEGTDAERQLREGDVLFAIDGVELHDYQTLVAHLAAVSPGASVDLGVERDGTRLDVPVVTTAREDGGALIGVLVDPDFRFPVDVQISIDGVGGPSAGLMFALGIVDKLSPADEADGVTVAGTGTIDVTGDVGPIGGIRQKLAGAARDGAAWFLAPEANCGEVVGHVPAGLSVVEVATLAEAVDALTAIGAGRGASLPTCQASDEG